MPLFSFRSVFSKNFNIVVLNLQQLHSYFQQFHNVLTLLSNIDAMEQFSLAHSGLIQELAGASLNGELRLSQICCEILEAILNSIFSLFQVNF